MANKLCLCGCGRNIRPESTWAKGHNPNKTKDRFDWSKVAEDYERLGTITKVAEKYGCTSAAVSYQMKKMNIKTSLIKPQPKINIDNVVQVYEQYKSVKKTAEVLGFDHKTIRKRLEDKGYLITHDNKTLATEVGLGRFGERIALEVLEGSVDKTYSDIHYPHDIDWMDFKIDVKTSRIRKNKGKEYHSFNVKNKKCTHLFLIALNKNNFPIKMFLIPENIVKGSSIYFTKESSKKYNKFEVKVPDEKLRRIVKNAKKIR